jgi:predicted CoA-binding protein
MPKKTVAVLGASADRSKFSNKAVRAYLKQGWDVFPINPKGGEIEGLTAYRSLADVPVRIDRVTLYLPPALGLNVLPDLAKAKPAEFFVNPGAESDELLTKAENLGLHPIAACSIVDIGVTPAQFPG